VHFALKQSKRGQAHTADECVEIEQAEKDAAFHSRLMMRLDAT